MSLEEKREGEDTGPDHRKQAEIGVPGSQGAPGVPASTRSWERLSVDSTSEPPGLRVHVCCLSHPACGTEYVLSKILGTEVFYVYDSFVFWNTHTQ